MAGGKELDDEDGPETGIKTDGKGALVDRGRVSAERDVEEGRGVELLLSSNTTLAFPLLVVPRARRILRPDPEEEGLGAVADGGFGGPDWPKTITGGGGLVWEDWLGLGTLGVTEEFCDVDVTTGGCT